MTTHGLYAWKAIKATFAIVMMGFVIIAIGDGRVFILKVESMA